MPLPFTTDVPMVVVPSRNVTVPVAVPAALQLSVAVNVTDWPSLDGFREELTAVVVLAVCTTWLNPDEALPLKSALPL